MSTGPSGKQAPWCNLETDDRRILQLTGATQLSVLPGTHLSAAFPVKGQAC